MPTYKRILSTETIEFLKETAIQSTTYGKHMATYISAFTMLMKTCKGRDKLCAIIQYLADFYYNCNKYSEIAEVIDEFKNNCNLNANMALKLRSSMKNCRKIFKFLKFVDQISSIVKNIESKKPFYLKTIAIMEHLMAFYSNLFDNIIWGINTQVLSVSVSQQLRNFKSKKYFFSLWKIIFKMLANNFLHHKRIKSMKQIITELKYHKDEQVGVNGRIYDLCKQYLKHRREVRIQEIQGIIMIIRIIMLMRKLKLPGYTFITKIMYSCCGLISTLLSAYKMLIDQPLLIELKEVNNSSKPEYEQQERFQSIGKVKRINFARSGSLSFK